MSIDEYLRRLALKRLVLACSAWDVRVCVSPTWHRPYWAYKGKQEYVCEICEKLAWIA